MKKFWEAEFLVVCDVLKETTKSLQEINDAQVTLIHCCSISKNAADEKLKQLIRKFADIHKSDCCIVLISDDVNFAGDLLSLRYRKLIHIILIHTSQVSRALLPCANEDYNLETFFGAYESHNVSVFFVENKLFGRFTQMSIPMFDNILLKIRILKVPIP